MSEARGCDGVVGETRPSRAWRSSAAVALLAIAIMGTAAAATRAAGPTAHSAHTIQVKDEAKLHFVHSSGSTLIDEGPATGTIPGMVRIRFTYNGSPNVSATFTVSGHSGSLSVQASGKLSSPTNPKPSFTGTMRVTGGSGRYTHAHGSGHLYGVFNRRTYALTVQTTGTIGY